MLRISSCKATHLTDDEADHLARGACMGANDRSMQVYIPPIRCTWPEADGAYPVGPRRRSGSYSRDCTGRVHRWAVIFIQLDTTGTHAGSFLI